MRANRKLWAAATVCAAVVAGVTGCSQGDDKAADPFAGLTADAIAKKSIDTTKAATAFRMNGVGKADGEETTVDFAVDDKGNCQGTMTTPKGGKAEMLATGGTSYMKGDDAFWSSGTGEEGGSDEMAKAVKGRWMKMPAGAGEDEDNFCDLKKIVKDMEEDTPTKGLTREADADVDGTPTAVLSKKEKSETTTFYVAKDSAKPYILRVVTTGGDDPGTVTLSDFGKAVTVTAPPASEVVDMEELMKGAS
ncbi:lipoprotein [Streptomyces tanashiensis]|uniref:hypothetical protein n=1 Tax=Streptomyces tanashiensis TaxID=67367 RepID=UPI00167A020B|nr:hypothetical protein [Streptomyces tanashiensis]GGS66603.1 lipoprotein [Streptomyces tanashiensis]